MSDSAVLTSRSNRSYYNPLTFAIVEVQPDALALVDVQVGEPHGEGQQDQQQKQFELLPNFLYREAQHPRRGIVRWPGGGIEVRGNASTKKKNAL